MIEKLKTQKGILIEHAVIPGANHFFENCVDPLIADVGAYLDAAGRATTTAGSTTTTAVGRSTMTRGWADAVSGRAATPGTSSSIILL